MTRLATAVLAIVFLLTQAAAAFVPVSAYSGQELLVLRAGLEAPSGLEIGVQGEATTNKNFWEQDCTAEDTRIGGYVDLKIDLGPKWHIVPVVGLQGSLGVSTKGAQYGPEAGIRFNLHDNVSVGVLVQYRWLTGDLDRKYADGVTWLVGAGVRF